MLNAINSRAFAARAAVVSAVVMGVVLLSGPANAAGETSEVTDSFTALGGDVTTMGLALLGLISLGVVIGLAIRFLLKGKKAASGV